MATCSICRRRPVDPEYKPFCSKRCADVDLQRWFSGAYAIPVRDEAPAGETPGGDGPDEVS